MDKILIRDLVARGIIGVNDSEREKPQEILINITMYADIRKAGASDKLEDTINYRTIAKKAIAHAETAKRYTVEALATDIANLCLEEARIDKVCVRVEKPGAVRFAKSVGVEIERSRDLEGRDPGYPANRMGISTNAEEFHQVYLGLGSNIAPDQNLIRGVTFLRQYVIVKKFSSVWETEPVPAIGPNYLNAAVLIQTRLSASLLKSIILHRIEVQLGRVRTSDKNSPRTVDLDILIYDNQLVDTKVWTHAFVAVPLAELIPSYLNPTTGETLSQTADRLTKLTMVRRRPDIVLDH